MGNDLGYLWIIILVLFLLFGVPIFLLILGFTKRKNNKEVSKKLFIAAIVYLLVGLGFCGSLMI
jgi:heme O synthase-like polyprenyltransferase